MKSLKRRIDYLDIIISVVRVLVTLAIIGSITLAIYVGIIEWR